MTIRDAMSTILYSPTAPEVLIVVLSNAGEVASGIKNKFRHLNNTLELKNLKAIKKPRGIRLQLYSTRSGRESGMSSAVAAPTVHPTYAGWNRRYAGDDAWRMAGCELIG
jgi:hypothetical protein